MSNKRISWSSALRDIRSDHLARPAVREERLRRDISAWRGKSGRRYVFHVDPLSGFDADEAISSLAVFITRSKSGIASIVFGGADLDCDQAADAFRAADERGCTEVHITRLWDASEQEAILADLNAEVLEVA